MATAEQQSAKAYIQSILEDYGLPASLADWAWERIVNGDSQEQVALDLRETPEFMTRFPAIQAREAAGLPPISPAEYVAYEKAAGQLMRLVGLPAGFYDDRSDYTQLLANDVSLTELNDRISADGFQRVAQAPPEVRDAFGEFFGVQGDSALAAFFIDPDRAAPVLKRMATQADIAGRARLAAGLNVDAARAGELADIGITGLQVQQAAANVGERSALFNESVSERDDLTGEREGLNAALGVGDASKLAQRTQQRTAAFSGGGGAAAGQGGVAGLGSNDGGL
jgi:hypothetical protein